MKVTTDNLTEALVLLKEKLHKSEATFVFTKKDGTERTARGTLNISKMGEENAPKGTGYSCSDTVTRFYDLDAEGWRSFNNISLTEIYI